MVQIVADGSATALALLAHIIDAAWQGLQSTKNLEIMVNALLRNACCWCRSAGTTAEIFVFPVT